MGAMTISAELAGTLTTKEVHAAFSDLQEGHRISYGEDLYNGGFNNIEKLRILSQTFANRNEAFENLEDQVYKREALAAYVGKRIPPFAESTKVNANLLSRYEELARELERYPRDFAAKMRHQRKSAYIGCSGCGSKISVQHWIKRFERAHGPGVDNLQIRGGDLAQAQHLLSSKCDFGCPVCGEDKLRAKSERERHTRKIYKLKELREKLDKARQAYEERHEDKGCWLIVALAPI